MKFIVFLAGDQDLQGSEAELLPFSFRKLRGLGQ